MGQAPGSGGGGGGGGPQQQEATRFEVKIRIQEKEAFRPGMSVTGEIETRFRSNVLCVPIQSVTTRLPKETKGRPPATNSSPVVTNAAAMKDRKPGEALKPIEVVFLAEGDTVRMVPVKRGISDDDYTEILDGLKEGQEVVSGGYKSISRDLEEGKRIKRGDPEKQKEKEKK
jgi:HlyD family secretion protein